MKMNIVLAGLLLSASSVFASPHTVDVSHSSVGFKVKHMMVSTVSGNFGGFSGVYDLDKGVLKSLSGTVKVATINTGIVKRDDHLRSADFFDVSKYPDMTFVSTSHKGNKVVGNLTMHGVSKSIALTMDMGGVIQDNNGNKRSGFTLDGKINRKDFGLAWNKLMEAGGTVVGDEIRITIDIEGIED